MRVVYLRKEESLKNSRKGIDKYLWNLVPKIIISIPSYINSKMILSCIKKIIRIILIKDDSKIKILLKSFLPNKIINKAKYNNDHLKFLTLHQTYTKKMKMKLINKE